MQYLKPKYALFNPLAHCERPLAIALSFPLVKVQSKQKNFNALAKYPQTTKISIRQVFQQFFCTNIHSRIKSEKSAIKKDCTLCLEKLTFLEFY